MYLDMRLEELKIKVKEITDNIRNNGVFPKENNIIDYKLRLSIDSSLGETENLLRNFAKDIISFSNGDGGIILIGFEEDKVLQNIIDKGLDNDSLDILRKIDLNLVIQGFEKIAKGGINIDLQEFKIGARIYFYLLIEKQTNVLVSQTDDYKLKKGDIYYRKSGKNEHANKSTTDFNTFLQIKANEKNKEFMDIWSKLLPEMFDINPREVLIINPKHNKVYGYNAKDNLLSSSKIEIDQNENGIFNIILNAISAGDIGKISNDEGKPIYKIVGELKVATPTTRDFIYYSDLEKSVKEKSVFNFDTNQFKMCFKHLGWTNTESFSINNPKSILQIDEKYSNYIWIEKLGKNNKVVFSEDAVSPLIEIINDESKHISIFSRKLNIKK